MQNSGNRLSIPNLQLNEIIKEAIKLPLVPLTAIAAYEEKIPLLTQYLNEASAAEPSIDTLIGNNPSQIMYDNDKHLTLGGHLMLTNEKILEKMSVLTNETANMACDLHRKYKRLEEARSKIKILSGIIQICMHCKEIRDDTGYWNRLEKFITDHSEAQFSHSICPSCMKEIYPEFDGAN